jgi:hypothetical protein
MQQRIAMFRAECLRREGEGIIVTTNADRSAIAAEAVALIAAQYGDQDDYENLTDLLANLRHWSDAHGVDFYAALDMSYRHYLAETQDERDEWTPLTIELRHVLRCAECGELADYKRNDAEETAYCNSCASAAGAPDLYPTS